MINATSYIYSILIGLLTISMCYSCKTKKQLTGKVITEAPKKDQGSLTADQLLRTSIPYKHWIGKADASYSDGTIEQEVVLNLQSIYNQKTFLSVRAGMFGVTMEAALGLATVDSVIGINKVQSEYYLYSFDQASKFLNAPIDFKALQNLFVGNPLITNATLKSFNVDGNTARIEQEKDGFTQTLIYDKTTHRLQHIQLVHPGKKFEAQIYFSDYRLVQDAVQFAFKRNINILYNGKRIVLTMAYSQVDFKTPVDIKFSIPRSYRLVH